MKSSQAFIDSLELMFDFGRKRWKSEKVFPSGEVKLKVI